MCAGGAGASRIEREEDMSLYPPPADKETELRPALQTIFHDADHPSYIRLPIIPR